MFAPSTPATPAVPPAPYPPASWPPAPVKEFTFGPQKQFKQAANASPGFLFPSAKEATKPAAPPRRTGLADGVEGVTTFPSRTGASYRFELVAKDGQLHIWLEDRKTKKQWRSAQLAMEDFAAKDSVIPSATLDTYAKSFLSCLESSEASSADFTRDLVAVADAVDAWELQLSLKFRVFSLVWTPTYAFTLKPVPLEPVDLLAAKVRDQEDEIAELKRQIGILSAQQKKPSPGFNCAGRPF